MIILEIHYSKQTEVCNGGLVSAKADDYLLSMIKYVIEKSEIRDREAFYHWVHIHLSPPLELASIPLIYKELAQ